MKINLDKNDMYSCVREIIHDWMPIFVRLNLCLFLNTRTKNSLNWNRMKSEIPNKNYQDKKNESSNTFEVVINVS